MEKVKISPSILSADFSNLEKSIETVRETEWLHLDVMDGHFVPNLTFGPCIIESIRDESDHVFDTHLMISDPEKYLEEFVEAGSDIITFHAEAVDDMDGLTEKIKEKGTKAGISLKPDTPIDVLSDGLIRKLDLILIMTVEPGFSGQSFMHEVVPKIEKSSEKIDELGVNVDIAVDGGISPETAPIVVEAGANVLVSGSSVFEGNVERNLQGLRRSVR